MSRSEEKARAALNRWRQFSTNTSDGSATERSKKRRKLATECNSLSECEQTRKQLLEQITAKIEEIQRIAPDEHCKKLNDEINKLLRIKFLWERQIRALGGPDYRQDPKQGREYIYFGAAKELPEVKALFRKKEADSLVSKVSESIFSIDSSKLSYEYYGFDDSDLASLEAESEPLARKAAMSAFEATSTGTGSTTGVHWSENWTVPTKDDLAAALLNFRKEELLRKYAS